MNNNKGKKPKTNLDKKMPTQTLFRETSGRIRFNLIIFIFYDYILGYNIFRVRT